jgi:hypothetical protein
MLLIAPPKNLTEAICIGIKKARENAFHGNMPNTGEFFCKWVTDYVRDYIIEKFTPITAEIQRQSQTPIKSNELQDAIRHFSEELGLGIQFEMEEIKNE